MVKIVRNQLPLPQIQAEEGWTRPLEKPGFDYDWHLHYSPNHRLYYHQTLASTRQDRRLKHPFAPKDSLDIVLSSVYNHSCHNFQDKSDIVRQPDTIGLPWYRLHRNVRVLPDKRPAKDQLDDEVGFMPESASMSPGTKFHGIKQGGVTHRTSPSRSNWASPPTTDTAPTEAIRGKTTALSSPREGLVYKENGQYKTNYALLTKLPINDYEF